MGASEWWYFVPYQPDVQQAFFNLRTSLFEQGAYSLRTPDWKLQTLEEWIAPLDLDDFDDDDRAQCIADFRRLQAINEPTTIDELLEWNGEEGTASILDMTVISHVPELFAVSPLTSEQLVAVFGTLYPTHQIIEQAQGAYHNLRRTWSGLYIIVYQDGNPSEIFFTGFYGD